jgi:hypothetical protein
VIALFGSAFATVEIVYLAAALESYSRNVYVFDLLGLNGYGNSGGHVCALACGYTVGFGYGNCGSRIKIGLAERDSFYLLDLCLLVLSATLLALGIFRLSVISSAAVTAISAIAEVIATGTVVISVGLFLGLNGRLSFGFLDFKLYLLGTLFLGGVIILFLHVIRLFSASVVICAVSSVFGIGLCGSVI